MTSSKRTIEQRRRRIALLGGLVAAVSFSVGDATSPAMYFQYFCESDYMVKAEVLTATLEPRRHSEQPAYFSGYTPVCPDCESDPVKLKVRVTDILATSASVDKLPIGIRLQKGKEVTLTVYLYNSTDPWPIEMDGNILIAGARVATESQRNVTRVFENTSFIFVVRLGHDLRPYHTDTWMPSSESKLRELMTKTGCGLRPTS